MLVVATAGHVDHGKSSLVEALTGINPDRFEEERQRGLTIDLGFALCTLPSGRQLSFVDVPGHVRFLRNMLAGVGSVQACVFVVAATEGWKPQSEEHLRILSLLGYRAGVVALTKRDLVDEEWCELQALDVADRLAGSFLADAPIVPVSAVTGAGLDDLGAALDRLVAATPGAADRHRPRLWIDRVFAAKGSGTVVTGTLTGGSLATGQQVDAGGRAARIRGIQSHGTAHDTIAPGARVALNLAGVDHHQLHRGDAVTIAEQWRPSARLDASLEVLASLGHRVSRRGAYVAYIGSGEVAVRLRVLGAESLPPGSTGAVRLHLAHAVPVVAGDRFILRESGRDETVGGGEVLDAAPVLPASKARPDRSVDRIVAEHGWITADHLEALTGERRAPSVGGWVVAAEALTASKRAVAERVGAAGPPGVDIATLAERERAVVPLCEGLVVEAGRVRPAGAVDQWAGHPFLDVLRAAGVQPPEPTIGRGDLRELVRRGLVVERDGVFFHPDAIAAATAAAAELLAASPEGFTVSQLRDALGVTRKHALPLANELDGRGITRRRGDLRIAGPRLTGATGSAAG